MYLLLDWDIGKVHLALLLLLRLKGMATPNCNPENDPAFFTVTSPSKAEQREAQETKSPESSRLHSVFLLFVAVFIAVALLLSLIATKLTVVAIGQQFNVSCTEPSCIIERENETPYIMMILIMMIPQFISFISEVSKSAFSKQPWPSKRAILWVSFYSFFSSFFTRPFIPFIYR